MGISIIKNRTKEYIKLVYTCPNYKKILNDLNLSTITSRATFFCEITSALCLRSMILANKLAIVCDLPVPGGPLIIVCWLKAEIIAFSWDKSVGQILAIPSRSTINFFKIIFPFIVSIDFSTLTHFLPYIIILKKKNLEQSRFYFFILLM